MLSATFEAGGNTTHRHLDSHPQLMVYPTESMLGTPNSANILTPAVPFRYAWPSFDSEVTPEQAYHLFYDEEVKTFLRTRYRSKFKDCGMEMDEKDRIRAFINTAQAPYQRRGYVEAYFRSTFEAWKNFARTGRETHYVGYLPAIHMDADKFFQDFPDGHMIYVSRNPWSGFSDTIKRPFPWSLEKYCQLWNVFQSHAKICQIKYHGRFHVIRYEDLVRSPAGTLNRVMENIGLDRFAETPAPSFNRTPLTQVYPWGTIKSATREANIATAQELSLIQAKAIETECYFQLVEWGYEAADFGLNPHED